MTAFNKSKLGIGDKLSMYGFRSAVPGAAADTVILKVSQAGYVPPGFTVRSRIDDILFTAVGDAGAIEAARHDASVESISLATKLRQIG